MLSTYRPAILFLVRYLAVYFILNLSYAWFVERYKPDADPITIVVTKNVVSMLALGDASVHCAIVKDNPNVPIVKDKVWVVAVYEGCNGVNVMIVFVAFLAAFKGPKALFWKFLLGGLISIYVINLFRVMALYGVALHFPDKLYFFHKFFFTGLIYAFVFMLWYLWVNKTKTWYLSNRPNE